MLQVGGPSGEGNEDISCGTLFGPPKESDGINHD